MALSTWTASAGLTWTDLCVSRGSEAPARARYEHPSWPVVPDKTPDWAARCLHTDGEGGQVERAEQGADLLKDGAVARVTCEEDPLRSAQQSEAAPAPGRLSLQKGPLQGDGEINEPQRLALVEEPTIAPVLAGRGDDAQSRLALRLGFLAFCFFRFVAVAVTAALGGRGPLAR